MNISKYILPQIENKDKASRGKLKRGITKNNTATSFRPVRLEDILRKFEDLQPNCQGLDEPIRMLKMAVQKLKTGSEFREVEMQSRALKAEQKTLQLRRQLKKVYAKYNHDVGEIVKMKILSQFSQVDNNSLIKTCNYSEIYSKISETVKMDTFALTEATLEDFSSPKNQENIFHKTTYNQDDQIMRLKSQIQRLSAEISVLRAKQTDQLKDIVVTTPKSNLGDSDPVSVIVKSEIQEHIRTQHIATQTQGVTNDDSLSTQCSLYKQLSEAYKQQCVRRESQQMFLQKALLHRQLNDN